MDENGIDLAVTATGAAFREFMESWNFWNSKPSAAGEGMNEIHNPPYLCPIQPDSLSPAEVAELSAGRPIYIWGGAFVGQGIWRALTRHGFEPAAFLDRSPRFEGQRLQGLPVLSPENILGSPAPDKNFIITASGHFEHEMRERCLAAGLTERRDFLSFNDLVPMQPTVDVSGVCNLRCQGCARGNMDERPPAGFMEPETFRRVLDKLLREIPFLGTVQLYIWGEPLLNRHLNEILREIRSRGLYSIVSTNLNLKIDLREFIDAGPSLLRLSASGWGPSYERTHTGGDWKLFHSNLLEVSRLRRELAPEMSVELYYHLYRHNRGEDFQKIKALSKEAGFVFRPIWGCLYPWDNLMRKFMGPPLTETAEKHCTLLLGDLDDILKQARENPGTPCSQVRCLPINWNLEVLGCGGYYLPRLAENYLEIPLAEIVRRKMGSKLCRDCDRYGIHRVNNPFVEDRLDGGEAENL